MKQFGRFVALSGALSLAACSTAPAPAPRAVAVAKPTPRPAPYRWTHGNAEKARQDMVATFGVSGLHPGDFRWAAAIPKEGETRIVTDLLTQMTYVYRGDVLVGATTISSGKKGKETQLGFWSILQKKPMHRSRKYDDAPMPFMQRIDDKGIAFHAGKTPGYPASHGCIRLPPKFAEKLYTLTKIGTKVIIEG